MREFLFIELSPQYRERGYDRCSDVAVLSDALHAEDVRRSATGNPLITLEQARTGLFGGASMVTFRVREYGDAVAERSGPPCVSCALLGQHFGFLLLPPASSDLPVPHAEEGERQDECR